MEDNNKEWLERVINEQKELCIKIGKLAKALDNKEFINKLDEEDVILLKEQLCHMLRYAIILDVRIDKAGEKRLLDDYIPIGNLNYILDHYPIDVQAYNRVHHPSKIETKA